MIHLEATHCKICGMEIDCDLKPVSICAKCDGWSGILLDHFLATTNEPWPIPADSTLNGLSGARLIEAHSDRPTF